MDMIIITPWPQVVVTPLAPQPVLSSSGMAPPRAAHHLSGVVLAAAHQLHSVANVTQQQLQQQQLQANVNYAAQVRAHMMMMMMMMMTTTNR